MIEFSMKEDIDAKGLAEKILIEFEKVQRMYRIRGTEVAYSSDEESYNKARFNNKVIEALNLLDEEEKKLLVLKYVKDNGRNYNYLVEAELGISSATFYRRRASALQNFYRIYQEIGSDRQ